MTTRNNTRSRGTGRKNVRISGESPSGRNTYNDGGTTMSQAEFVRQIEQGNYDGYHVRVINGVKTPVSNPDGSSGNNLE